MGITSLFVPKPKNTAAAQEAARKAEQERMATEAAKERADKEQKAVATMQETESKRRAFAGSLTPEGDEQKRNRFLKAI